MRAIFISDVHLISANDKRYVNLLSFFDDIKAGKVKSLINPAEPEGKATQITDLYIAGDLFDFWFCSKDKIYPEFVLMINKLVELQKSGINIHLSEGNHDFFLKEYFNDVLGMEVFEEWADVKMDNLKVLIAHGDTMDKTNSRYLMFRKILRSRIFYEFQRFIPARIRWILASISSRTSKKMNIEDGNVLVEKMLSFSVDKFQEGYDAVILGHSHVPVLRHYTDAGKKKTFVSLGDWIDHKSFLYYENRNFILGYYK